MVVETPSALSQNKITKEDQSQRMETSEIEYGWSGSSTFGPIIHGYEDDGSVSVEIESQAESLSSCYRQPIVVAYAFGPKKMKSMGVVMAEASRIPVIHEAEEEGMLFGDNDTEEKAPNASLDTNLTCTPEARRASKPRSSIEKSPSREVAATSAPTATSTSGSNLTSAALASLQSNLKDETNVIVTLGNSTNTDLKHIVRFFRSSCSSTGSITETTVSTPTTTNTFSSATKHSKSRSQIQISFVPLDLDIPLEEQHGGHFDLILHKLTEDILTCTLDDDDSNQDQSKEASIRRVQALAQYPVTANPRCCMVDDPANVQTVMNRSDIAKVLRTSLNGVKSKSGIPVTAPKFVVVHSDHTDTQEGVSKLSEQLQSNELAPPLMVKPLVAAGTKESHHMTILLEDSALSKVPPRSLIQEFVNHNALLYKVYVMGQDVYVYQRPSLPNLPSKDDLQTELDMLEFDSQRPYPRLEDFGIITNALQNEDEDSCKIKSPPSVVCVTADEVRPIVETLRVAFGLELFGFDILLSEDGNEFLVVDVNYFPSYKEVPNFPAALARYLSQRVLQQRRATPTH